MDSIFHLNEAERASLLQHIIHSFGCTYICLWSHFPHPPKYLYFMDGFYHEEGTQASSSSGSTSMRAFAAYQKSMFFTENSSGGVPGLAFKNNLPYMELKSLDLLRLTSTSSQLQFYQEARIKTAIFMGCKSGEIEIGMSSDSQANMEMEMKKLFPEDFSREPIPQPADQTHASSSSSSLRSLSIDTSAENSPFLFNMLQSTSYMPEIYAPKEASLEQPANPMPSSSTMMEDPIEQALSQIRGTQVLAREIEEAAMTKAILAVITSASPSSSASSSHHIQTPQRPSAFRSFRSSLAPTGQISTRTRSRQNLIKRSISFFKSLGVARAQQGQMFQTTRPTSNQLQHMIKERRRREKLNESFQALRSLLPPGSKKDKGSVLSNTTEYLTSLKSQVEELKKRNQMLEAQLSEKEAHNQEASTPSFSSDRLNVRITDTGESTSETRVVDLEVNARGESIILDLVIRVLEFIKQVEDVTVMSIEAETRPVQTDVVANRVILRLRIQGSEWDQSSFQEAVKRVVDDLAQ